METGQVINEDIFSQLLEMDDDDTHSFSKEIIDNFFEQLQENIPKFSELMERKDYEEMGRLGHFLKGSSAAVGAEQLRLICEQINHYDHFTNDANRETFLKENIEKLDEAMKETKQAMYQRLGASLPPGPLALKT
jgi:osomolarity two-component system, phosphorelay intermediate protein YPD1